MLGTMRRVWFIAAAATVVLGLSGAAFVRAGTPDGDGGPPKPPCEKPPPSCGCRVLDICGRVLACGTGTPVSGEEICIEDSSRTCVLDTTTDPDGVFHFTSDCFPEGFYVIEDKSSQQLLGRVDQSGSSTFIWFLVDRNSDGTIDRCDLLAANGTGELNFVGLNCDGGSFPEEGTQPFGAPLVVTPLSARKH